ncbi:hypothetical protein FEM54_16690 [Pseudomonas edaphica]|uniref:Secreted protein n=1 Tax=Pseudomonas edaphica TaxID=2006980 RepID=A0ABY2U571_9PSED|nr:hypothetical protein FEM54_16690 [Pseudomonas edaphica]
MRVFALKAYSPPVAHMAIQVWRPDGRECASWRLFCRHLCARKVVYDGCARETLGSAGFLYCRFANLRTAVTHTFGDV